MTIASLALQVSAPMAWAFERATKDPMRSQRRVLFEYLARNKDTEYGRRYGFGRIMSVDEYRRAVPLSDCENMRPYLTRMAEGETRILTADAPVFFGATSGTTSAPKYIPTTRYSDAKKTALLNLWAYYIVRDHPRALKGKILALVSPEFEGRTPSGIPFGGESGHGYKNLPPLVKNFYILPYEVFEIPDYDARYYTILRIAMAGDVTTIATLNPNSIILLCKRIVAYGERIIADIECGTLDKGWAIPADIRRAIERRLRPDPVRAATLRCILSAKKELLPKDFWPDLDLVECWKGGTMHVYVKELVPYLGNVAVRDIGCLSTEARSSIPMSDEGAGGVLAIGTNFYEFIPKEDIGRKYPRTLLCDELEQGKEYFLVVTTAGGLYRYNLDDIVRLDGFFNRTPVIEFVQKGLDVTSLAGEKLYESQVNEALRRAVERCKVAIEFFCATPALEHIPRYALLVEFAAPTGAVQKQAFLAAMEEELRRENREYDYVRNAQLLRSPFLKVVQPGEFERYRAARIRAGAHEGQFKAPELTPHTDFQKNFTIEEEFRLTRED